MARVHRRLMALVMPPGPRPVACAPSSQCWCSAANLARAQCFGWSPQADKLFDLAVRNIPLHTRWQPADFDPRWEKPHEPFLHLRGAG